MLVRSLDLNTRTTLKHWSVPKALIELVANALDEAKQSNTDIPILNWSDNRMTIQDRGRGLRTEHFQQNINPTKSYNADYIGKFGVGLKDALTVLFNKDKEIVIESKYLYTDELELKSKHNFEEKAIHVQVQEPRDKKFVGTFISVSPVTRQEYRDVRSYFEIYAELGSVVAITRAGKIYARKKGKPSAIYLNGIKVNEEANFLYQYAVVGDTKKIMTAMCSDRDRNKITRNVYSDKVQQALEFACNHNQVVRDTVRKILQDEEESNYDEFRYAKIRALRTSIIANPKATPPKSEVKSRKKSKVLSSSEDDDSEAETLAPRKITKVSTSSSDEDSEDVKEEVVPPQPKTKPKTKVHLTPQEKEHRDVMFTQGKLMLTKIFTSEIPPFRLEEDSDEEDALTFTKEDIKTEKIFFRRLMKKYVRYCMNDPDEEPSFLQSLIRQATVSK